MILETGKPLQYSLEALFRLTTRAALAAAVAAWQPMLLLESVLVISLAVLALLVTIGTVLGTHALWIGLRRCHASHE